MKATCEVIGDEVVYDLPYGGEIVQSVGEVTIGVWLYAVHKIQLDHWPMLYRVISEPYADKYKDQVVDVEQYNSPELPLKATLSLSEFGLVPFSTGEWNDSAFLMHVSPEDWAREMCQRLLKFDGILRVGIVGEMADYLRDLEGFSEHPRIDVVAVVDSPEIVRILYKNLYPDEALFYAMHRSSMSYIWGELYFGNYLIHRPYIDQLWKLILEMPFDVGIVLLPDVPIERELLVLMENNSLQGLVMSDLVYEAVTWSTKVDLDGMFETGRCSLDCSAVDAFYLERVSS